MSRPRHSRVLNPRHMIIHASNLQLDTFVVRSLELFASRGVIIVNYFHAYDDNIGELRLSFMTNAESRNFYERIVNAFRDGKKEIFINDISPIYDMDSYVEYIEQEMKYCCCEKEFVFDLNMEK